MVPVVVLGEDDGEENGILGTDDRLGDDSAEPRRSNLKLLRSPAVLRRKSGLPRTSILCTLGFGLRRGREGSRTGKGGGRAGGGDTRPGRRPGGTARAGKRAGPQGPDGWYFGAGQSTNR